MLEPPTCQRTAYLAIVLVSDRTPHETYIQNAGEGSGMGELPTSEKRSCKATACRAVSCFRGGANSGPRFFGLVPHAPPASAMSGRVIGSELSKTAYVRCCAGSGHLLGDVVRLQCAIFRHKPRAATVQIRCSSIWHRVNASTLKASVAAWCSSQPISSSTGTASRASPEPGYCASGSSS